MLLALCKIPPPPPPRPGGSDARATNRVEDLFLFASQDEEAGCSLISQGGSDGVRMTEGGGGGEGEGEEDMLLLSIASQIEGVRVLPQPS